MKTSIVWKCVFAVTLIFIDRPFQNIIQQQKIASEIIYIFSKWNVSESICFSAEKFQQK